MCAKGQGGKEDGEIKISAMRCTHTFLASSRVQHSSHRRKEFLAYREVREQLRRKRPGQG